MRQASWIFALLVLGSGGGFAQSADIVVTPTIIHTGEVVQVEADGSIVMQLPVGEIKILKADIRRVTVHRPAALDAALEMLKAGKYREAVQALKPIAEKYAGLPTPWAQAALLRLGEAYQAQKDYANANQVFERFVRLYPDAPAVKGMEIKFARVQVEQNNYNAALAVVEKFLEPLLAKEALTEEQEAMLAEALIVRGDCWRGLDQPDKALDSYLLVTTIYDSNDSLTAEASYKAAQTFERLNNLKRARELYEQLQTDFPNSEYATAARQRLSELAKATPS